MNSKPNATPSTTSFIETTSNVHRLTTSKAALKHKHKLKPKLNLNANTTKLKMKKAHKMKPPTAAIQQPLSLLWAPILLLLLLATSAQYKCTQAAPSISSSTASSYTPASGSSQAPLLSSLIECGAHRQCENGGTCLEVGLNRFTCACPHGYTGPLCEQDVNECDLRPSVCLNGATCLNKPGGYQCNCVNGWTGNDCSENVDDCTKAACWNDGKCIDHVGRFSCQCKPGKTGLLCQLDDGCFTNPCHPNATCDTSPVDGHAICTCQPGFTGPLCSDDIDECESGSPCEHGGLCVNTPGSFTCQCPRGFSGPRCETNINECINEPCMNGATCLDDKGGFKCICMPGYAGNRCQIPINWCDENPCLNQGTCYNVFSSFRCDCPPGFHGQRCEQSYDQTSLSPSNPWAGCRNAFACWTAFKNGKCDQECNNQGCLFDGNDCFASSPPMLPSGKHSSNKQQAPSQNSNAQPKMCDEKYDTYCLNNYANNICDQECNNAECGWDALDCERQDLPRNTYQAQGLLVIRVEPAIEIGSRSNNTELELARLLRKVSIITKTILKVQNLRQVDENGVKGTEIELIADNSKCEDFCYNSTELIAKFLLALKTRTNELDPSDGPNALRIFDVYSREHRSSQATVYTILMGTLVAFCAVLMVISTNKQKVKEKAVIWFPEGFKTVPKNNNNRHHDPTDRKGGRGVSTLQALGGNFLRGFRGKERVISTNPNGVNLTDIDRCSAATPNGSVIYHEPFDQYDQYGTCNGTDSESIMNTVDAPMTPAPTPLNPINIEGPHGLTPLMMASMGAPFSKEPLGLIAYGTTGEISTSAESKVTDLLHRGAQLNLANKLTGETALHLAARHGRVDAARGLLERCDTQDVNAKDASGRTPLHAAIAADSLGVFELLIRCRSTDLNVEANDGTTPLILATRVGTYSMLEELILNECEVTRSDKQGKTALHWAAATNNVDAIKRLLAVRETNKDAQDLAEETPLFLAAREGAKGAVEILLNHNANKDISDQMDRSPLEIARSRNHYDIVRLLEDHEPPTSRPLTGPIQGKQLSPFSPPPTYDDSRTFWNNNNNNPNMLNVNNNVSNSNHNNNNNHLMDKTHGLTEVYNVPCLKNFMTPSPDSPFSVESSMASPPGAYNKPQYQNPNHPILASQNQTGVFI